MNLKLTDTPFDFSQYAKEVEDDLRWRKLTEKELPQFYNILHKFKIEVDKKEFSKSLVEKVSIPATQN
jgi:hypothetical protein